MLKTKIFSALFIIITIVLIICGLVIVIDEKNYQTGLFTNDGYAVVLNDNKNKTNILTFQNGTKYNYKKYNNKVSFSSNDGNVKVDDSTVIHYQDKSLLVLKDTVGVDINTVDNTIIFYYNIFRNTQIKYENNKYKINVVGDSEVNFNQLLLRITDNKFLLLGNNIRAVLSGSEVVGFNDYVYFEYSDGSIIKIYNDEKSYQTISDNSSIVTGDISINLKDKNISKNNKKYISLSNLVIDMDGNVDTIPEEIEEAPKAKIEESKAGTSVTPDTDNNTVSGNYGTNEITENNDTKTNSTEPVFTISGFTLNSLKIDATIEIDDKYSTLSGPVNISIVENQTAKVAYEFSTEPGDLRAYISYPNLKSDTEYTLYVKASCLLANELSYDKTFISKIFRTESLGIDIEKNYVTADSINVLVRKETYSKVNSVMVGIFNSKGSSIEYQPVSFNDKNEVELVFDELDSNTEYVVKMYDILSAGVTVDNGLSMSLNIKTLKHAPSVGKLEYSIDKRESSFKLNASSIKDNDYGIVSYRFDVYDVREGLTDVNNMVSISAGKNANASVSIDNVKIHRGVPYTYRMIIEFYDNEKTIEYSYDLGSTMQMDGVDYPTLRWEETSVTWEQINGSIIVNDPNGAIIDNKYKIIYKNSVDIYSTMTLSADTVTNAIPIGINYLRANETYTFDVYAKVNLQDGNPTIDEAYIGSIKVHTKSPNSLLANFTTNLTLKDPFSIDFTLTDKDKSAQLEANTLSTITFTLYQGSTTDGMIEVLRKTTDTNINEYISTLKDQFYNNTTTIDAKFFGHDNSSFKQKNYTLVINDAYDYTGINKIPIENNVFKFETLKYIPELPENDEPQITTKAVLNKFASSFGLNANDNLDGNTTIAYQVKADFDNSSKLGKYVIYHVWCYDYANDKYVEIKNLERKVSYDEDGILPATIFDVLNGTNNDTVDTDNMYRGNSYYFTADVYLDIDEDGQAETCYPLVLDSKTALESATLTPLKQQAKVYIYPSISDSNSFTWKYKISDIDNSLVEDNLYGFVNANRNPSSSVSISKGNNNYLAATFTNLSQGNTLSIKTHENRLKGKSADYYTVTSQYFYGYKSTLDLDYSVQNATNKFVISFNDYESKLNEINSITRLDVKIVPVNDTTLNTKTISNVDLTEGNVYIDYATISEYVNKDIRIELIAYFDSGNTGFDVGSEYVAIQKGSYNSPDNYYLYKSDRMVQTPLIYGVLSKVVLNIANNTLNVNNMSNQSTTLDIEIDNTGVVFQDNNIVLKEIKTQTLVSSNNVTSFNFIIPSVSLIKNNKADIVPLVTGAYLNAKIIENTTDYVKDNDIYIELFELNESGSESTYVDTITKKVSDFDNSIELTQLKLKTNYYVKLYAFVYNATLGNYEKIYLYDVDQKILGCSYNFHTLEDIGISNVTGKLESEDYNNKKLVINYSMLNTIGFDNIKYTLYHKTSEGYEQVDVKIPDSKIFLSTMRVTVAANPNDNTGIRYGDTYMLKTEVYASYTVDGQSVDMILETKENEFVIGEAEQPFIGISSGKTENSIFFRVSIIDSDNLIVDGKYKTVLLDSNGEVVASSYNNSIDEYNKKIVFDIGRYDLIEGETYTFRVVLSTDYNNSGTDFKTISSTRTIKYGANVFLGTITLSPDTNSNNGIDMIFTNSYQLNLIDKISYTITNDTKGFVYNATKPFSLRYDLDTDAYYCIIEVDDVQFDPDLLYLVTVNFYIGNELVETAELGYGSR